VQYIYNIAVGPYCFYEISAVCLKQANHTDVTCNGHTVRQKVNAALVALSISSRAALSIWWALRTSPCRGRNPSVDRRVRWMRRAPDWQGAPDGQQAKKLVVTKMFILQ